MEIYHQCFRCMSFYNLFARVQVITEQQQLLLYNIDYTLFFNMLWLLVLSNWHTTTFEPTKQRVGLNNIYIQQLFNSYKQTTYSCRLFIELLLSRWHVLKKMYWKPIKIVAVMGKWECGSGTIELKHVNPSLPASCMSGWACFSLKLFLFIFRFTDDAAQQHVLYKGTWRRWKAYIPD